MSTISTSTATTPMPITSKSTTTTTTSMLTKSITTPKPTTKLTTTPKRTKKSTTTPKPTTKSTTTPKPTTESTTTPKPTTKSTTTLKFIETSTSTTPMLKLEVNLISIPESTESITITDNAAPTTTTRTPKSMIDDDKIKNMTSYIPQTTNEQITSIISSAKHTFIESPIKSATPELKTMFNTFTDNTRRFSAEPANLYEPKTIATSKPATIQPSLEAVTPKITTTSPQLSSTVEHDEIPSKTTSPQLSLTVPQDAIQSTTTEQISKIEKLITEKKSASNINISETNKSNDTVIKQKNEILTLFDSFKIAVPCIIALILIACLVAYLLDSIGLKLELYRLRQFNQHMNSSSPYRNTTT